MPELKVRITEWEREVTSSELSWGLCCSRRVLDTCRHNRIANTQLISISVQHTDQTKTLINVKHKRQGKLTDSAAFKLPLSETDALGDKPSSDPSRTGEGSRGAAT